MKIVDEEQRGTGRTLRLVFRALSYAGERKIVYLVLANNDLATRMQAIMLDMAAQFHIPTETNIERDLVISTTRYKFCGVEYWINNRDAISRVTVIFDHYALEVMESGE